MAACLARASPAKSSPSYNLLVNFASLLEGYVRWDKKYLERERERLGIPAPEGPTRPPPPPTLVLPTFFVAVRNQHRRQCTWSGGRLAASAEQRQKRPPWLCRGLEYQSCLHRATGLHHWLRRSANHRQPPPSSSSSLPSVPFSSSHPPPQPSAALGGLSAKNMNITRALPFEEEEEEDTDFHHSSRLFISFRLMSILGSRWKRVGFVFVGFWLIGLLLRVCSPVCCPIAERNRKEERVVGELVIGGFWKSQSSNVEEVSSWLQQSYWNYLSKCHRMTFTRSSTVIDKLSKQTYWRGECIISTIFFQLLETVNIEFGHTRLSRFLIYFNQW